MIDNTIGTHDAMLFCSLNILTHLRLIRSQGVGAVGTHHYCTERNKCREATASRTGAWNQELSLRVHTLSYCGLDSSYLLGPPHRFLGWLSNTFSASLPCSGERSRLRAGSRWIALTGHGRDCFKCEPSWSQDPFLSRADVEDDLGEVGSAAVSSGMSHLSSHHGGWGIRHPGLFCFFSPPAYRHAPVYAMDIACLCAGPAPEDVWLCSPEHWG